jgi:hypothetical protein
MRTSLHHFTDGETEAQSPCLDRTHRALQGREQEVLSTPYLTSVVSFQFTKQRVLLNGVLWEPACLPQRQLAFGFCLIKIS